MKAKPKNAVIYARVSSRLIENRSDSIFEQLESCEHFCKSRGLKIVSQHNEISVSGLTPPFNRTKLGLAIEDCQKYNAVLVVSDSGRISRDIEVLLLAKDYITSLGIEVYYANTHAESSFSLSIRNSFAEYDRQIRSERTKAGIKRRNEKQLNKGTSISLVKGRQGVYEITSRLEKRKVINSKRL